MTIKFYFVTRRHDGTPVAGPFFSLSQAIESDAYTNSFERDVVTVELPAQVIA